jgi:hypothetical protein
MYRAVGAKLLQRSLDHIGQSRSSQGDSRAGRVLGVRLILTCERTGFFPCYSVDQTLSDLYARCRIVARLRHADCFERCPRLRAKRKTNAHTEFFSV